MMKSGIFSLQILAVILLLVLFTSIQLQFSSLEVQLEKSFRKSITPAEVSMTKPMNVLGNPDAQARISYFKEVGASISPMTDKVGQTAPGTNDIHRYHNMYGMFLFPLAASKPKMKLLEIGMGCVLSKDFPSVKLWKALFPQADLWEAEYNSNCVKKALRDGYLDGINPLVGDQADYAVLDSWIEKSGGNFDAIIDDGGHTNCQIGHSFDKLWPTVAPGGYYFVEDLHVGKMDAWRPCDNGIFSEKVKNWQEQLIYSTRPEAVEVTYPLPENMIFVYCQHEACVFGKRHSEINDPYIPEWE